MDGQPGLSYLRQRLRGILFPSVRVKAPPNDLVRETDLEVVVRDGTTLRVNVHRPQEPGRYPVLISYHPYGKDLLPRRRWGRYQPLITYRLLRQTGPFELSALTGWEAPDPATWVPRGYVVVNADMRGFHRSEGEAEQLICVQEGQDYHDLIEWAASQPWSNGRVGLSGVSYLALTQWWAASTRPPSLRAICAWEGFSDVYRDLAFPGGVREKGFTDFWFGRLDRRRVKEVLPQVMDSHPLRDDYWAAKSPPLEQVEVPALVCASFSDHNLHSGGSFSAFERLGSRQKWLYTHRTGKWAAYYSEDALAWQERFFAHFLKDEDTGMPDVPPVRLEVRESRDQVHAVRAEREWPLARTCWRPLYLRADGGSDWSRPESSNQVNARFPQGQLSFLHTFTQDTELTGPMKLRLYVSLLEGEDLCLFAGVRKLRGQQHVVFEGSFGFGHDLVTRGWLRLSQRQLDPLRSTPAVPVHAHQRRCPMPPGEIEAIEIALLPSATLFRAGESLRVDLAGRYFFRHHPLLGQFPAAYEASPQGVLAVHCGGQHDSHLLLPEIPQHN